MNWKQFFDRLGMNGTWWQWRIMRWEQAWRDWRHARSEDAQRVAYRNTFCSKCGGIIARGDAACPRCGARAPSWTGQAVTRALGLILPRWCPVVSALLFVYFAALVVMMVLFGGRQLMLPDMEALIRMGSLNPYLFFAGRQFWRALTYGYLHIGLLHIGFNMLALMQVGSAIEEEFGGARFFALYTLAMLGGAAADLWMRGAAFTNIAGASGALFGLIGFGVSFAHFSGGPAGRAQRGFFLQWAIYGFAFGYVVGADNICHAGGFVVGAIVGFIIERERRSGRSFDGIWRATATLLLLLTVASFVAMARSRWVMH